MCIESTLMVTINKMAITIDGGITKVIVVLFLLNLEKSKQLIQRDTEKTGYQSCDKNVSIGFIPSH